MASSRARRNFKRVLEGKAPRRQLTRAEARARLRAVDPGIDISASLAHLNRGEPGEAGIALAAEAAIALTLPSLRPLLFRVLVRLLRGEDRRRPVR